MHVAKKKSLYSEPTSINNWQDTSSKKRKREKKYERKAHPTSIHFTLISPRNPPAFSKPGDREGKIPQKKKKKRFFHLQQHCQMSLLSICQVIKHTKVWRANLLNWISFFFFFLVFFRLFSSGNVASTSFKGTPYRSLLHSTRSFLLTFSRNKTKRKKHFNLRHVMNKRQSIRQPRRDIP